MSIHHFAKTRLATSLGLLALTLLLGPACNSGFEEASAPAQEQQDSVQEQTEEQEVIALHEVYFDGKKVTVEEIDGEFVFEGDIVLPRERVSFEPPNAEEAMADLNKLTANPTALWPDGIVYYTIDPAYPYPWQIEMAMDQWEADSNLTFVEGNTGDYLYFVESSGWCGSYVGKQGGAQTVWVSPSCTFGSVIHEIGHAVGLWHEHTRYDRDDYVTIHWENIKAGKEHNFKTYDELGYDGGPFTDALDFDSIMMYGSSSFSSNGLPTITKKDGSTFSAQRDGLSAGDVEGINRLYPAGGGDPEYINGQWYTIYGLTVFRYLDTWYYPTKYGYKRVELVDGRWYWV